MGRSGDGVSGRGWGWGSRTHHLEKLEVKSVQFLVGMFPCETTVGGDKMDLQQGANK